MTIVDTAGVARGAGDAVESEGIARAVAARETAAAVIVLVARSIGAADSRRSRSDRDNRRGTRIVVANKADLPAGVGCRRARARRPSDVSAMTGAGLDELRSAARTATMRSEPARMRLRVTNFATPISWSAHATRSSARAMRRRRARPRSSCSRIFTTRASRLEEVTGARTSGRCAERHLRQSSALESNLSIADDSARVRRRGHWRRARRRGGRVGRRASWAGASGCARSRTDTIAHMPCNPAVGGTAKGHLVREIDALGGLMGRAIDATGIQFKLLNRSRGPAVWSPRAQADKRRYSEWVARDARAQSASIHWIFGKAERILVRRRADRRPGARRRRHVVRCRALVITTGTFLNGLVHVGPEQRPVGTRGRAAVTRALPSRSRPAASGGAG